MEQRAGPRQADSSPSRPVPGAYVAGPWPIPRGATWRSERAPASAGYGSGCGGSRRIQGGMRPVLGDCREKTFRRPSGAATVGTGRADIRTARPGASSRKTPQADADALVRAHRRRARDRSSSAGPGGTGTNGEIGDRCPVPPHSRLAPVTASYPRIGNRRTSPLRDLHRPAEPTVGQRARAAPGAVEWAVFTDADYSVHQVGVDPDICIARHGSRPGSMSFYLERNAAVVEPRWRGGDDEVHRGCTSTWPAGG